MTSIVIPRKDGTCPEGHRMRQNRYDGTLTCENHNHNWKQKRGGDTEQ